MNNSGWRVSTGFLRKALDQRGMHRLVAVVLVTGGLTLFGAAEAFASSAALSVSPSAGLVGGATVTVTGAGLAASAKGYVLECNEAPGEPTVYVGAPFDETLPIGCSAPSLKRIVTTTAGGALSTQERVYEGRKLGPPCGVVQVIGSCAHLDTAGVKPHADAQNYPCPPSAAQQIAGVHCSVVFIDTAQEMVSTPIAFLSPPPAPTPTTAPVTPTTAPVTPTTAPPVTPTTAAKTTGTSPGATTGGGGDSGGGTTATTAAAVSTAAATGGAVAAPSSSLAFTGLGSTGKILALVGAILVLLGLALYFFDVKRLAIWFLGL